MHVSCVYACLCVCVYVCLCVRVCVCARRFNAARPFRHKLGAQVYTSGGGAAIDAVARHYGFTSLSHL